MHRVYHITPTKSPDPVVIRLLVERRQLRLYCSPRFAMVESVAVFPETGRTGGTVFIEVSVDGDFS